MNPLRSFSSRLESELREIEASIVELWQNSRIEEFRNDPNSQVVFVALRFYWQTLPVEYGAAQAQLNRRYKRWYEMFHLSHSEDSTNVQDEIKATNDYVSEAIQLNTGWQTEPSFDENRAYLSKKLDFFRKLLGHPGTSESEFVVVPDTNALLKSADPSCYGKIVGRDKFTFILVPTVLSELDDLKRSRRDRAVGQEAEKVIKRLKGFRDQGPLLEGVKVSKTVTVKMIPTEPRMASLPSWLDPGSKDDRIIGSALEIQRDFPSAVVVLVTRDINLQNKAEMAFLPCVEPPEVQSGRPLREEDIRRNRELRISEAIKEGRELLSRPPHRDEAVRSVIESWLGEAKQWEQRTHDFLATFSEQASIKFRDDANLGAMWYANAAQGDTQVWLRILNRRLENLSTITERPETYLAI